MLQKQTTAMRAAVQSRRGAVMIEYALLAGLVALVAFTAVTSFGTAIRTKFIAVAGLF